MVRLLGVSFLLAVAVIAASFFVAAEEGGIALTRAMLAPGIALWRLSNSVCPPDGARCFLFSSRLYAHHLWAVICYVIAWWAVFAVALSGGLVLIRLAKNSHSSNGTSL
jgi:hypothetical protein